LNFFLTDGETLWGFCKGETLYYCYNETSPKYSVMASQPPENVQDGWTALNDYGLVILTADNPPSIISDIRAVFEFPKTSILSLFIIATLVAVAVYKRKTSDRKRNSVYKR
jgi:hypothetical protein